MTREEREVIDAVLEHVEDIGRCLLCTWGAPCCSDRGRRVHDEDCPVGAVLAQRLAASPPRTVRVRIAVAVSAEHEGRVAWAGSGMEGFADATAAAQARYVLGRGHVPVHWLEGNIPLPDQVTVKGEVV